MGWYSVLPRPLKSSSCYLKYFSVDSVKSFLPLPCSQLSLISVDLAPGSIPAISLSLSHFFFLFFFPLNFFLPSAFILHFPPIFPFFFFLYFLPFSSPIRSLFSSPFSVFLSLFPLFSQFFCSFFYPHFYSYFFSFLSFFFAFQSFLFPPFFPLYISLLR